jgi:hypothetical protein
MVLPRVAFAAGWIRPLGRWNGMLGWLAGRGLGLLMLLHWPGLLHGPGLPLCGLFCLPMLALAPAWLGLSGSRDCRKEEQKCDSN